MANILDILNQIGTAVYGKDVRQAIIDAIRQCYEDGKAGVNDLQARTLIEAVMAVNEQQAAEIEALTARVEELEEGESGGSSETSTTSVPTFLVESGTTTFENVGANKTATQSITFTESFTEAPTVLAIKVFRQGANTFYSQVTAQPIQSSITADGFTLAVGNKYTQAVSPSVLWVAFQPTTVEVETEITTVDGMTEADVKALLAPITAALDSLKIGYDGTEYDTAGASLREQVNALHVLIGDEPGTAIPASAIGYGENSNVDEALTAVNGRLDQLDGGGMTEEAKQALLNLVSHIGLWGDDHGQDYIDALEAALYPPASLTRITAIYTQSGVVYEGSELNNLKADLVVTAVYSDSTTEVITAYTLTGTLEEGTSIITVSYGGKTTTFNVTVTGSLLPSGYRLIEYVGADSGQYFEMPISITTLPVRVEMKIQHTSQPNAEQAILIGRKGTANTAFEIGYNSTANTMFAFSGTSVKITDPIVRSGIMDVVAEFNASSPYKTLSITADGETVSAQSTDANSTYITQINNIGWFGSAAGTLNASVWMYSCKVYVGNELIIDFIPCYSESEERAGLYDLVSETFYKSTGRRMFIKGGDV